MTQKTTRQATIFIAHRGYSGAYPENTLLSYKAAYKAGARFMELDLQLSKDQVPILHHDENTLRMTGVDASIFSLNAKACKKLNAHYPKKFGDTFIDNRLTTFKRYCKWLKKHPDVTTFVEIKQESIDQFGLETFMQAVLKRIDSLSVHAQIVIISFNPEVVAYTQKHTQLATGWVLPKWSECSRETASKLKPDYVFSSVKIFPKYNQDLWQVDWQWALYNLDDPASAQKMIDRGIRYLETNEIGDVLRSLTS